MINNIFGNFNKYFDKLYTPDIRRIYRQILLLIGLSLLITNGCSKNPTNARNAQFTISGYVQVADNQNSGVVVWIDNNTNQSTETDPFGYFKIDNVNSGHHQIQIKKIYKNGSFVLRKYDNRVNKNLHFPHLLIPHPIQLHEITEIGTDSIRITWTRANADRFIQYDIFRRDTTGFYGETGTLIQSITNPADTIFIDRTVQSGQVYCYRVNYTTNNSVQSISNSVLTSTQYPNLISNAGFEEVDPETLFPMHWGFYETGHESVITRCDTLNPHSGKFTFLVSYPDSSDFNGKRELSQGIPASKLRAGSQYKLTFWLWHTPYHQEPFDGVSFGIGYQTRYIGNNHFKLLQLTRETPELATSFVWNKYSAEFTCPSNIISNNIALIFRIGQVPELENNYSLDDIALRQLP